MAEWFEELDQFYNEHFGLRSLPEPAMPEVLQERENEENDDREPTGQCDPSEIASRFMNRFCVQDTLHEARGVQQDSNDGDIVDSIDTLREKVSNGCGCSKNCFSCFPYEEIREEILRIRELEKREKEMYIMGTLREIGMEHSRCRSGERKRKRFSYAFKGQVVCRSAFQIMLDVKENQLDSIIKHVSKNGIVPREHGSKGRKPHNALNFAEVQNAVTYLTNYADEFGLSQPAAPRGKDDVPPIFLPASVTKKEVYNDYKLSCEEIEGMRTLGRSSFHDIWLKCVPHIKICSPREDVCKTCEDHRQEIKDARTDVEKMTAVTKFKEHISNAMIEKETYRDWVHRSVKELETVERLTEIKNIHYTFDFANPLTLPHHARQVGQIYFTTPLKVQVFGVRIDGDKQYNFIINEDETIGADGKLTHGPNAVISMLHFAIEKFGKGETEFGIHADNCAGQNKNRYVLAYFCWRVMTGRTRVIHYMLQIPGHTRCLIDAGFGNIKRLYRRTDCDTIRHIAEVVEKSSTTNKALLFADECAWDWRDWKSFLGKRFRPLRGIRKSQYFRFQESRPGVVFTKRRSTDVEEEEYILHLENSGEVDNILPDILPPAGFSRERREFLIKSVRPLVRPAFRDTFCSVPEE